MRLMLIIIGLVEEDTALRGSSRPAGTAWPSAPTLGLLRELAQRAVGGMPADAWACAVRSSMPASPRSRTPMPRAEWLLRAPPPIWTAIRGERPAQPMAGLEYRPPDAVPSLDDLIVAERQRERLRQVRHLLAPAPTRTLVVRGMAGSDRLELVAALAAALGRGVLEATSVQAGRDEVLARMGPLCTLMRAVPVFCPDLGPSETFTVPRLSGYNGPIAVVLGREGGVAGSIDCVTVEAEPDTAPMRLRHWARALEQHPDADLSRIANMFTISGRYIRQCAPIAIASAALEGRSAVGVRDVRQASRTINRQVLESLATPIDGGGSWDQLVLGNGTESDLHDLERRCRHREQLASSVGERFPGGLTRGVRALFERAERHRQDARRPDRRRAQVGSDRTASIRLGDQQIHRRDRENLSRILSRAEGLDVVLLLDEGDALLSRRTDVKSANDRYANLETNYLLQRLESFDGIVIVTTNLGAQVDPAFRRRMDVVVRFHLSDAEQRWRRWQRNLSPVFPVDEVTLEEASVRYTLTGGQIRNAALYAALAALPRDGRVGRADLVAAIELEHRKAGASFHGDRAVTERDSSAALDRFSGAIS